MLERRWLSVKAMKELVANVAKLSLSSALQTRVVKAITTQCFRLPADGVWVAAHVKATKLYGEKIKKLRETMSNEQAKEKMGLPSTHGFNALVTAYILSEEGEGKEAMSKAAKRWSEVAKQQGIQPLKYLPRYIPHCRMSKMFDASVKRLEIAVPSMLQAMEEEERQALMTDGAQQVLQSPAWAWLRIKQCIINKGKGQEMEGMAPAGDLERKIQEALDAMREPS